MHRLFSEGDASTVAGGLKNVFLLPAKVGKEEVIVYKVVAVVLRQKLLWRLLNAKRAVWTILSNCSL